MFILNDDFWIEFFTLMLLVPFDHKKWNTAKRTLI
jgi:hypothetical protein